MEYGLIGEKLGHSFSKEIHNLIGNYKYELVEIPREQLDSFMKKRDFKAINVTIPYKQDVIPYLDYIDEEAKQIGAVNTIVNKNGKLSGYNTDFYGMKALLEKVGLDANNKNVLILGTGGTSKTATALVKKLGAKTVCKVSRHSGQKEDGIDVISYEEAVNKTETNIIINTTPCGMFPKTEGTPISLQTFTNLEGVIDAIFNPNCTNFVLEAKNLNLKAEGGLFMLVMQAIKAAEFFFEKPIEKERAQEIFDVILSRKENIVLTGMPACGKTTVGKIIAKYTGKELIDCDAEIVKKEDRQISEIFAENGEEYFRNIESQVIQEVSLKTGCIISTGGGAILRPENVKNLKKNGKIYFINRPLQKLLPTNDRPTANSVQKIKQLFEVRFPIYKETADKIIDATENQETVAKKIMQYAGIKTIPSYGKKDTAVFEKNGKAGGTIKAPPSKSLAHRMLICAALAQGESNITNVDFSQDIQATLDCIKTLGSKVEIQENSVRITGTGNITLGDKAVFKCRESGSTLRFFIPMGMTFSKPEQKVIFTGSKVLMTRPLSIYEDLCAKTDILFERKNAEEKGGTIELCRKNKSSQGLEPGIYEIPGGISSQFITGLLFVLPLLQGDSQIKLIPPIESRSYINLTIQAMHEFGVEVQWQDETTINVKGNQQYHARTIKVEGDYSNAAFLEVFNYLNGNVKVQDLNEKSLQGDKVYKTMFEQIKNGTPDLDISDCPDLGPVLFALAAAHNGAVFTGTRRLAIKESDRAKIMCEQLAEFGIETKYEENKVTIYETKDTKNPKQTKPKLKTPEKKLKGYNDHRIVMALSTLLTITGGQIEDAHAVSKSYPGYFEDISKLGIKINLI